MKILYIFALLFTLSSPVVAADTSCPIGSISCVPAPIPPTTAVPEPGTLMLMGIGLLAGFGFMRKK